MKILYIHQYFKTPYEPGATRTYWMSRALIEAGHEIIMVTQNKTAREKVEYRTIDGIQIIYIKNWYANEMSIPARIKAYFSFMVKSSVQVLKLNNIDLVISTSTPLSVGLPALILKKFKGIPYVFEVRDLWPEVPIQMGGLKNPIVSWVAKCFERVVYKNAKHIVALSPGMSEGVIKHISKDKVTMIPNMAKNDKFWPRDKNKELINDLGLCENSFKVIHFGAMGIANGLMYIMQAAKILKDSKHEDIEILFLGEGKAKNECEDFAKKYSLSRVHFYDRVPMDKTSEIVNLCDVSVVPFKNLPILATNSPNKLFDSLSAARPVVVNSNGWTRGIVENYKCGAYVDAEKPEELAALFVDWKSKPELLIRMGENGRKLAKEIFDKTILTKQFVEVIDNLNIK